MNNPFHFSQTPMLKVTGVGNDFVLVDLREPHSLDIFENEMKTSSRSQWAKTICHRTHGLGADGLVILLPLNKGNEFDSLSECSWDFYNQDGSHPKMCGNGIRCAADYLLKKSTSPLVKIHTQLGIVEGKITDKNLPGVLFAKPKILETLELKLEGDNNLYTVWCINSGVPHAVVEQNELEPKSRLYPLVENLRFHPFFGPDGANVTFFVKGSKTIAAAISFERGVENFTRACGTGALAVSTVLNQFEQNMRHEIVMPGGSLFTEIQNTSVILSGAVNYTYLGRLVL
jgi:diaminopimelate epimerase